MVASHTLGGIHVRLHASGLGPTSPPLDFDSSVLPRLHGKLSRHPPCGENGEMPRCLAAQPWILNTLYKAGAYHAVPASTGDVYILSCYPSSHSCTIGKVDSRATTKRHCKCISEGVALGFPTIATIAQHLLIEWLSCEYQCQHFHMTAKHPRLLWLIPPAQGK